jgi:hypothetical protein
MRFAVPKAAEDSRSPRRFARFDGWSQMGAVGFYKVTGLVRDSSPRLLQLEFALVWISETCEQLSRSSRSNNALTTMEKIVPLISSGTEGPLGLKHLPRLWIKSLLSATGRLPEGYKDIGPGFDFMVLEGLGINPDSAREFIFTHRPSYLTFEKWICEQPGVDVSQANISKINELLVGRMKAPEARLEILRESGLPEDCPIKDGIMLNNLDDWKLVHEQVTKTE